MKPLETPADPIFTMISPPWPSKSTMFICLLVGLLGSHHFYVAANLIIQKEAFLWRWLTSSEPSVNNGQIYHDMVLIIVYYCPKKKIQLQSSLRTSVVFFTPPKQWFVCVCVCSAPKKNPVTPPKHGDQEVQFVWWIPSLFSHQNNLYKLLKPPDPDPFMTPRFSGLKKQLAFFGTPKKMPPLTSTHGIGHQRFRPTPGQIQDWCWCFRTCFGGGFGRGSPEVPEAQKRKGVQDGSPCSLPVRVKKAI